MVVVLSLFAVSMMGCTKDDVVIPQSQLPQNAQTFINTYFQDCTVAQVIKDGREYEVYFANGFEIDFDKHGEWESIDCKNIAVPAGIADRRNAGRRSGRTQQADLRTHGLRNRRSLR